MAKVGRRHLHDVLTGKRIGRAVVPQLAVDKETANRLHQRLKSQSLRPDRHLVAPMVSRAALTREECIKRSWWDGTPIECSGCDMCDGGPMAIKPTPDPTVKKETKPKAKANKPKVQRKPKTQAQQAETTAARVEVALTTQNKGLAYRMGIEWVPIDSITPYHQNNKIHSDESIDRLASMIAEFGFDQSIGVDEAGVIIKGHKRLAAAKRIGMMEVPVTRRTDLSPLEIKQARIADNRATIDPWDNEALASELKLLSAEGVNMSLLGFDEAELGELMSFQVDQLPPGEGLTDENAIPTPSKVPITVKGDVWILGNHRVMCGDSTVITDAEKLMGGEKADLIFTDPPYGVDFKQAKFNGCAASKATAARRNFPEIENDELKGDDLIGFMRDVMVVAWAVSKEVAPFYVWAPALRQGAELYDGIVSAGWKVQSQIAWHKVPFVLGRSDYHWAHEAAWYGFKPDQEEKHAWYGERDKHTVWTLNRTMKSDLHPTMKPVELSEIAITNSSKPRDIVLDLFGGSGSTLIGAHKLGRWGYIMELVPTYTDTIVRRWCEYTGEDAKRESDGADFLELQIERDSK